MRDVVLVDAIPQFQRKIEKADHCEAVAWGVVSVCQCVSVCVESEVK